MKWVAIRDLEAFVPRVSTEFRSGSAGRCPRAQECYKYAEHVLDFRFSQNLSDFDIFQWSSIFVSRVSMDFPDVLSRFNKELRPRGARPENSSIYIYIYIFPIYSLYILSLFSIYSLYILYIFSIYIYMYIYIYIYINPHNLAYPIILPKSNNLAKL